MEAIKLHTYKAPMHINLSEPSFLLVMLLNSDKQKNKIRSSMNFSELVPSYMCYSTYYEIYNDTNSEKFIDDRILFFITRSNEGSE